MIWHRFSAFWLRSKCSICSYQLNIWYAPYMGASILNWFLELDEVSGACSAFVTGRPGIAVPPGMAHHPIGVNLNWMKISGESGDQASHYSVVHCYFMHSYIWAGTQWCMQCVATTEGMVQASSIRGCAVLALNSIKWFATRWSIDRADSHESLLPSGVKMTWYNVYTSHYSSVPPV